MSGNGGVWVTVKGSHIFIKDNETFDEAIARLKKYDEKKRNVVEDYKNSKFTQNERDSIDYWVKGNNGWGYNDIRQMANGLDVDKLPQLEDLRKKGFSDKDSLYRDLKSELLSYKESFDKAVNKMPDVKGEVLRFSESTRVHAVGEEISMQKYTSFTTKMKDNMFDNFGHGSDTVVYSIKNAKDFADMTKYSIENEAITRSKHKYKVVKVEDANFGGELLSADMAKIFGKKYAGGRNYKKVILERV